MTDQQGTCGGGKCESCGMAIESGPYCPYCQDENGQLQEFSERLNRMSQWMRKEQPELTGKEAEDLAIGYMAKMPAWQKHPELLDRL